MAGEALSPIFNRTGIAGFTLMRSGVKFPPIEDGWQNNGHSFKEAIAYRGNIGLLAGNGYGGLDQDDLSAFDGLTLPETATWETRPGRLGMWLIWSDNVAETLAKYGFKADQAQIHLYDPRQISGKDQKGKETYKHVGEVKLERAYQVIPPSWKVIDGQRVNYRMLKEISPAEVSLDWLLSELLRIGLSFSEKSKEPKYITDAAKIEQKQAQATNRIGDTKAKAREFLQQALNDGTPGNRNEAGFWLACQLRDLGIDAGEASEHMRAYARGVPEGDHPYTEEDAQSSLEQAYSKAPREPPRSQAARISLADALLLAADLKDPEKLKADPGLPYESQYTEALAIILADNRAEYERIKAAIKKAGISTRDLDKLVKAKEVTAEAREEPKKHKTPKDIIKKALKVLKYGDPVKVRLDYVKKIVMGNGSAEKALIYSAYSVFLPESDKLHADIIGSSQVGKTARAGAVLSTFPQENIIMLTEASPKSLYYMQKAYAEQGICLNFIIIYLDDARPEHVPLLKSFRNDGPITPRNATVADGEYIDIPIEGRPVILASSVVPLRDLEGQATSRTFLITVSDPTEEEELKIRRQIRKRLEAGGLMVTGEDKDKQVLQEIIRITKNEGVSSVIVPFDAKEPDSADRRGTGQFIRLIKISAYIYQFQRPILEMKDGSKHVLAIYDDLKNAAELWFAFDTAQKLKIADKHVLLLNNLPETDPTEDYGMTITRLAMVPEVKAVMSQKTVTRYIEDLYDNGLAYKRQIKAAGSPFAYWTDAEVRQKVMSQISASADCEGELGQIRTKSKCPKYMAEKSPDSLTDSIKEFFSNQDIIREKDIRKITDPSGRDWAGNYLSYLSLFQNPVLNTPEESEDSDHLGQGKCPNSSEVSTDIDLQDRVDLSKTAEICPAPSLPSDEDAALVLVCEKLKRESKKIAPFILAVMASDLGLEISPKKCEAWMKEHGWSIQPGQGWQEAKT